MGPFNLGNPGEFTMLELAKVSWVFLQAHFMRVVSLKLSYF